MATTRALPWAGVRAGCLAGHHRADRMRRLFDHRREDAGVKAADKTANGSRVGGRAAEWSKKKYAGSVAEDLWRRLDAMEVINQGMLFAATLLLCLFPFLIVASALAGRPLVNVLARYTGLNSQAAADVDHLFASSAATGSAVVGTASMVFFVFGGIATATALQQIYERAFDLPHRGMKDILHRLAWLAVLIGASLLTGRAGPGLRHVGGPALLAVAGLVWCTGF
jgi:membrane protein